MAEYMSDTFFVFLKITFCVRIFSAIIFYTKKSDCSKSHVKKLHGCCYILFSSKMEREFLCEYVRSKPLFLQEKAQHCKIYV